MNENAAPPTVQLRVVGLADLKKKWGWAVGIGAVLILLGIIMSVTAGLTTLATMLFIGTLLIIGGVGQIVHAIGVKQWGGFFLDLLSGILYLVVGGLTIFQPANSAVALTLLIALFLIFSGIFRVVSAIIIRFQNWLWVVLHGVITLALGVMIWQQWPLSGIWVIGLFVGIEMIFNGLTLVMLGLVVRNAPDNVADK